MRRLRPQPEPRRPVLERADVEQLLRRIADEWLAARGHIHPAWEALRAGLPGEVPTLYEIRFGDPIRPEQVSELADRLLDEANR